MPNDHHRKAQEHSAGAELALARGDRQAAEKSYLLAAELEGLALQDVPADRPRSRGILAVSYVSLLFKAARYERAERAVCGLLAEGAVGEPYREQLRELLMVAWEEQLLAEQRVRYSGEQLDIALRGGKIGLGEAPADVAVHYLNGFNLLAHRAAEYKAGLPLRRSGPASMEIRDTVQSRATQPAPGSYRFSIKFVEPLQPSLFEDEGPIAAASRVSDLVFQVLRAVAGSNAAAVERLVSRQEYRVTLARLARNLVPAGDSLKEVEVRLQDASPLDAVRLVPELRRNVNQTIRDLEPKGVEQEITEEQVVGILRAVNLDKRWLRVVPDDGRPAVEIRTDPDEIDDVIGPMVNRRVSARLRCTSTDPARHRAENRLVDIELQED